MRLRNSPHPSILLCSIVQSDPYTSSREWLGSEIGIISVGVNLASNPRIFEDIHRLHNNWSFHPEDFRSNLLEYITIGKSLKNSVKLMQRVTNLIQTVLHLLLKLILLIKSIILKKESNFIPAL